MNLTIFSPIGVRNLTDRQLLVNLTGRDQRVTTGDSWPTFPFLLWVIPQCVNVLNIESLYGHSALEGAYTKPCFCCSLPYALPPASFNLLRKEVDCEFALLEEKLVLPRACTKQLTSLQ